MISPSGLWFPDDLPVGTRIVTDKGPGYEAGMVLVEDKSTPNVMVPAVARIRRNSDGEIRDRAIELCTYRDVNGDFHDGTYIWEEGNFACDCNRRSFFYGDEMTDEMWDAGCTDDQFDVQILIDGKPYWESDGWER